MEGFVLKHLLNQFPSEVNIQFYSELDLNSQKAGSFFMFSKHSVSPQQVQRINTALQELNNSGELTAIIKKYLSTGVNYSLPLE